MSEPTGNRWVNQDTGEIANKDNIQTDLPGNPGKVKYGPSVTGQGDAPVAVTAPVVIPQPGDALAWPAGEPMGSLVTPDATTELPEIEGRKLGPAVLDQGATAQNAEIEQLKLDVRNLRRASTDTKGTRETRAAADAELGQIAMREYGRPDGGRGPIKRALSAAGFGNPTK